jgi:hypothetical protein
MRDLYIRIYVLQLVQLQISAHPVPETSRQ